MNYVAMVCHFFKRYLLSECDLEKVVFWPSGVVLWRRPPCPSVPSPESQMIKYGNANVSTLKIYSERFICFLITRQT